LAGFYNHYALYDLADADASEADKSHPAYADHPIIYIRDCVSNWGAFCFLASLIIAMDPSVLGSLNDATREGESQPTQCNATNDVTTVHSRQNRNQHGWRRIVLNFTPSWFSVTMGTGIASILLHNLPYNGIWLYWISVAIFALNVVLFSLFTAISIARYTIFRGVWSFMVKHPVQSLFLGMLSLSLCL
jgi:hypothetical protein